MKRVLFIYYMFPPMVGGWRAIGSFVKYLPELGWQATVISAADSVRYPKDYSSLEKVPEDVDVHRVGHPERPRLVHPLLNRLRINIDFPDSFKGWYAPALREGRKLLSSQEFDLVFSYGPPYTCHFVAMQLKKEFNIPWVACFADLWSGNTLLLSDATLIRPLRVLQTYRIIRAERRLLEQADSTIVRGWYQRQQLCEMYGKNEDEIDLINHGYDESDFHGLRAHALYPDRLTITFLGTFYSQFQESFQQFLVTVNKVARDGEVVLVGRGGEMLQYENLTHILYLPSQKALAFCLGSDFLLVIMPPSAPWIPMKMYDYLRLGKPILALVPEDGDVARIIKEANAGFVLPYDQGEMGQSLKVIFDEWRAGKLSRFQPDWAYISQLELRNQTHRIVQVFDQALSA